MTGLNRGYNFVYPSDGYSFQNGGVINMTHVDNRLKYCIVSEIDGTFNFKKDLTFCCPVGPTDLGGKVQGILP